MTMLVIDENAKIREMLKKLFKDDTIYECNDAHEALAVYAKRHPDWVLMDAKTGDIEGVTPARALMQRFPGARVIILSQFNDPLTREQALATGAIGYVLKEDIYTLPNIINVLP